MTIKIIKRVSNQVETIPASELEPGKAYMWPDRDASDTIFIGADIFFAGKTVVAF